MAGVVASRTVYVRGLVYGGTAAACALIVGWSVLRLATDGAAVDTAVLPVGLPQISANFRIDALSAFFLLVVNFSSAVACLFGWGYERAQAASPGHGPGHGQGHGPVRPLFPLFIAGMNMVLLADDAFVFLSAWEFMSVTSWLLVLSNHREPETPLAARIYLIMAAFGTVCLLLAFGLLAGSEGDYSFAGMRAMPPAGLSASLCVFLVLAGAGSKAGLVPLHVWLPLAHPAAPSHVSALMSGVMTKVAIYGIIRVLFDLIGEPVWWWGGIMMGIGALTAVLGVLYALMQDDMKKVLAYSTVENIGAIVIALGLALVFKASQTPVIAALAMAAAMLHIVNHSLFKSLLFFAAGAVLAATGSRDMNRLGGLIHRMPVTAVMTLIGAAAISALPPLNGFVGEWLLFQAILNGPALPQWVLKIAIAVIGALLALATTLAAGCFVRLYGTVFLGRPRSADAAQAGEVGMAMRLGMGVPAVMCVLIGVLPTPVIRLFEPATRLVVGAGPFDDRAWQPWFMLAPTSAIGNSYGGIIILAVIAILSLVVVAAIHRWASDKVRRSIPWGCGCEDPDPDAVSQYTPSSFAQPIRRVFGSTVFLAEDEVDMPEPGEMRPAGFRSTWIDPAWVFLFRPIGRTVQWLADLTDSLQFLTIRSYLTMMFGVLVVLLTLVAVTQR
jgi:formate hydrogenlyase subunit 3/multisubunit Na+/H+ antiporter MnhD subunit